MSAANSQALALAAAEMRTLCDLTGRLYDLAAQQAAALALLLSASSAVNTSVERKLGSQRCS